MPYYESVFIARQDISATQAEGLADDFTKAIEDKGGKVAKRESWGLRNLAYRIKKNRKGHYVLFTIDAPSEAISEMERQMRLNEDVLRYMTIRIDELEEGPSVMMQNKGGRDERPRRGGRGGFGDRPDFKPSRPAAAAPASAPEAAPETAAKEKEKGKGDAS